MSKRLQKNWKRENRPNKGVSEAAKRQAYDSRVRAARKILPSPSFTDVESLAFAKLLGGRS